MSARLSILIAICVSLHAGAEGPPLQPIPRTERIPGHETRRILPTSRPARPKFIIGVWYPPAASMSLWKARGVNTAVGYENQSNTVTLDEWNNAANGEGLHTIRASHPDPADDVDDPYLLAVMHVDEPDLKGIEPPVIAERYAEWKKAAPQLPVFLSVSGGGVLFQKTPRVAYKQYFTAADWIANDFYPITGWNQPTWIPRLGEAVGICRTLSGGKPQFAFVETSSQQLAWLPKNARGVTPAELRAEIWHAVIHGVKGIIYFPQQFNPFVYDATPSNVSLEMVQQNRRLTELAEVIALPPDPKGIKVIVSDPLEVTWRKDREDRWYAIVLNLSDQSQNAQKMRLVSNKGTAALVKWDLCRIPIASNQFIDDFLPYECRVYELESASQGLK